MSPTSKNFSAKKKVNGHSTKKVKSKVNTLECVLKPLAEALPVPVNVSPLSHFRACKRGVAHFDGIDAKGPNKVLPPTFEGIKNLVKRVGEDFVTAQYASEPESPEANLPKDTLRDFLNELQFADNVERQTLIREFSDYVNDLEEQITSQPPATGAVANGTQQPTEGEPPQGEPPVEQ